MARDLFNWESRSVGVHLRQPPNRQVAVVSERSAIRTSAVRLFAAVSVLIVAVAGARFAAPRVLARIFRVRRAGIDLGPDDFGVIAEDVTILESNGRLLKGWFAAGPVDDRPRPAVLVIHGWNSAASLMLPIAPLVHAAGMHALFLDACCHGRSDEDRFASMPRFAEDIEAGLRWLRADSRVDPECVTLVGHSVGAGAALLVASRDPRVAAVVSIAAMAHPGTFMREIMRARGMPTPVITLVLREIERAIGLPFDTFAPVSTIARIRVPVLLIHGGRDDVVPPADATLLERASEGRAQLLILPEATHASMEAFLLAAPAITDFITNGERGCPKPRFTDQWS
jgi:pimeloyl-ACP methyl ester carboxylesterase